MDLPGSTGEGSTPGPPDGLWLALVLDGRGGARELGWAGVRAWRPGQGALWIHLDPRHPSAVEWLDEQSGLTAEQRSALLQTAERPRLRALEGNGFIASLRGLAPSLDEDSSALAMVRMWIEPERSVSLSQQVLPGVQRAAEAYRAGQGPRDLPALILWLASRLSTSLHEEALDMEDSMAELENLALGDRQGLAEALRVLQRRITRLRQHVAPMKIFVARLLAVSDTWLVKDYAAGWTHLSDETQDTDDVLQALQERVGAVRDSIQERLARRTNQVLYVLTILSAIMLPLTFLTGLMGINVGIQGASYRWMESTRAFFLTFAALAVLAWLEWQLIKRQHLL
ncbi:MAG TPA: CorA family divalent cation transporter [Myxococcaceae bacterium]|jgi:zinc transporter